MATARRQAGGKRKVAKVMRKQAVAIALSEARRSGAKIPAKSGRAGRRKGA